MTKIFVVALSAFALIAAGCAHRDSGQSTDRSAGTVIDDSGLTARVKTAIAKDVGTGTAANVNVTTYRGTVQLSGFVDSRENAARAEAAAKKVDGVKSVKNDVRIKSSS